MTDARDADTPTGHPPPGSLPWFAMLFSPPGHRPAIAAIHALWHELESLPRRISDPAPMQLRLAWWEDELGRLERGVPRHPATRAVSQWLHGKPLGIKLLRELLIAAEDAFDGRGCEHADELRLQAFRRCGAALGAIALACGAPEARAIRDGRDTGQLVHCTGILAHLGPDLARGYLALPLSTLEKPETLLADDGNMPAPERVAAGVEVVHALGETGNAVASRSDALPYLRMLAALNGELLARAERGLRRHVPPGPARLPAWQPLWLAWRSARAIARE